jgi:hypothetical protein
MHQTGGSHTFFFGEFFFEDLMIQGFILSLRRPGCDNAALPVLQNAENFCKGNSEA